MEPPFQIIVYFATASVFLSPLIFITIREAIKRQQQEIITHLAIVYDIGDASSPMLIPSFEFVKYRYFFGANRTQDPATPRADAERNAALPPERRKREDYPTFS